MFIGHDPNVHKGPCESFTGHCDKCPYLVRQIGASDKLCHGVKDIKSKITEKNKKDKDQKETFVLYTYIPVFDSLSSSTECTPYLVDSPGVEVINDDVKSYYSILSAMIYVENYVRLLQNEDNIKKELGCKPENASLFFAVSHFDKYYTSHADELNPNGEETKVIVERNIELVRREEVFPVCGLWALHAHLAMKYKERDQMSYSVIEEAYRKVSGEESLDNKASFVLETSAFKELEEKLKCLINETNFHQWNIMMYKQCQALLEGPIRAGDTALLIIESKINESFRNVERIKVKIEVLKNLEEGVQKYASEELEQNIQQLSSIFFTTRVSPKIEEKMTSFYSGCINSANNDYTFGQYLKGWDEFSKQDLSDLIKQELDDETRKCVEHLEFKLREKYKNLIRHILDHDSQRTTFTVEAEIQKTGFLIGEPSEDIRSFVNDRTKMRKWWHIGWGTFTGVAGVTVAVLAAPFAGLGLGLGLSAIALYNVFSTTDQNMKLSKEDVKKLNDKMKCEIKKTCESKLLFSATQAIKDTLRDYNKSLKAQYDKEWGLKLNKDLLKAQSLSTSICEEKSKLTQALDELKEYSDTLQGLVDASYTTGDDDYFII
ncbi:PREDICTED: uncharacterized protein LOC109584677 isoform X2 [Amphimedon queenslandica]|nr:PREDICTED: uncharacterized protein LOC109584677 isoform X2 [Amphimedon queenslandica]|eukprot:XP_019856056.1 PREDICTED: uncharacterized protein LOC109584677 isoform X2 [Amphimedon queenslandica]